MTDTKALLRDPVERRLEPIEVDDGIVGKRALLSLTELSIYDQTIERTATGRLPHRVTVALKDGRRLDEIRQAAKGDASLPFSADERKVKFLDCACFAGLPAAEAEELFAHSSRPTALGTRDLGNFSL